MIRCVWVRAQDDLMVLLTFVCLVGGLGGGGVWGGVSCFTYSVALNF